MFIRQSLVKTQIKTTKRGRRSLMRTLGIFDLHTLVDNTYYEFSNGKSIDKIFQENAVAKKHKNDYKVLVINKFLKEFDGVVDHTDRISLKRLVQFTTLLDKTDSLDLGFVYCIKIHNKIKIGKTRDILTRLATYKSHVGHEPEILKLRFELQHTEYEAYLIKLLANTGITNEWFDEIHQTKIMQLF